MFILKKIVLVIALFVVTRPTNQDESSPNGIQSNTVQDESGPITIYDTLVKEGIRRKLSLGSESFKEQFEKAKEEALNEIKSNIYKYDKAKFRDLTIFEDSIGNNRISQAAKISDKGQKSIKVNKKKKKIGRRQRKMQTFPKVQKRHDNFVPNDPCKLFSNEQPDYSQNERILPTADSINDKGFPLVRNICKRMVTSPLGNSSNYEIRSLLSKLYEAEAEAQVEAAEIKRVQLIAAAAQQSLEEATNKVRVISATLHTAQLLAQTSADNANSVQKELAIHDKQMFEARRKVDAVSAEIAQLEAKIASVVSKQLSSHEISSTTEESSAMKNLDQCFGPKCFPVVNEKDG